MELIEVDFTGSLRVDLLERLLQLILIHVLGLAQELVQLVKGDSVVFVDVKLLEDLLQALLGEELLLVDADHHEFVQGNQAVT